MTRIRFTKTISTLLSGTDTLLVVAPAQAFADGSFLDVLPEELMRAALDLATDTTPGDLGTAASTLTGVKPRKLAIGVLPDQLSRYNAPSRAECVRRVVAQAKIGDKGRAAVLLLLDDAQHYAAAACAVGRALPLYSAKSANSNGKSAKDATLKIMAIGPDEEALKAEPVVQRLLESSREAARLVDTPPTELNPKALQAEAYRLVRGIEGVTKRAIVGEALLTARMGGLHAVGRCAQESPRLVVLSYKPKRSSGKHVALVGKGLTFDTGGLSLKTGGAMVHMKSDMGGAAAVLGAFRVLAQTRCKHRVSALLGLAENAIGPAAYKLDDVLTLHSGLTVEINNTDAEGRLVLADAVSFAARKLKADLVVDAATLTGAQLVATGKMHAAVVANDEDLEARLIAAGRASGDLVHPLPFAPELYKQEFKSAVADMRNSVADRANAQSSCAAQFVHWHLEGTTTRWGHVDMAGPAFPGKRATGFGVALLAELVRGL